MPGLEELTRDLRSHPDEVVDNAIRSSEGVQGLAGMIVKEERDAMREAAMMQQAPQNPPTIREQMMGLPEIMPAMENVPMEAIQGIGDPNLMAMNQAMMNAPRNDQALAEGMRMGVGAVEEANRNAALNSGVAPLPMGEEMFTAAEGGIVGFQDRGLVGESYEGMSRAGLSQLSEEERLKLLERMREQASSTLPVGDPDGDASPFNTSRPFREWLRGIEDIETTDPLTGSQIPYRPNIFTIEGDSPENFLGITKYDGPTKSLAERRALEDMELERKRAENVGAQIPEKLPILTYDIPLSLGERESLRRVGELAPIKTVRDFTGQTIDTVQAAAAEGNPHAQRIISGVESIKNIPSPFQPDWRDSFRDLAGELGEWGSKWANKALTKGGTDLIEGIQDFKSTSEDGGDPQGDDIAERSPAWARKQAKRIEEERLEAERLKAERLKAESLEAAAVAEVGKGDKGDKVDKGDGKDVGPKNAATDLAVRANEQMGTDFWSGDTIRKLMLFGGLNFAQGKSIGQSLSDGLVTIMEDDALRDKLDLEKSQTEALMDMRKMQAESRLANAKAIYGKTKIEALLAQHDLLGGLSPNDVSAEKYYNKILKTYDPAQKAKLGFSSRSDFRKFWGTDISIPFSDFGEGGIRVDKSWHELEEKAKNIVRTQLSQYQSNESIEALEAAIGELGPHKD